MPDPARSPLLLRAAQRVLRTAPGRALGRPAYAAVARLGAYRLGRIAQVDSVYGTGTITRLQQLAPGYSDVDLFMLAVVPGVDDELALRRALERAQRELNRIAPVFRHLEYLELQDLDRVRHLGTDWVMDLDRRFLALAGNNRLGDPPALPPAHRELERLVSAFRRWVRAAPVLLAASTGRDPFIDLRGARRLLAEVLAARLDADRLEPLPALFDRAARTLRSDGQDALASFMRDPESAQAREDGAAVLELMTAALAVLDDWCAQISRDWRDDSDVDPQGWVPAVASRDAAGPGMLGGHRVLGTPVARPELLVLVTPPGLSAGDAAARMRAWLSAPRPRDSAHPALLTPGMWSAAALIEPAPYVGAMLARAGDPVLPPPTRPPAALYRRLLIGRLVISLWRLNGRALRFGRDAGDGLARMLAELELGERRLRALAGEPLSLAPVAIRTERDERQALLALRDYRARVRAALDPAVAAVIRHGGEERSF